MIDPDRDLIQHRAPSGLIQGALARRAQRRQMRVVFAAAAAALMTGLVSGWAANEVLGAPGSAVLITQAEDGPVSVRLVLHAPDASEVSVAGSFNGWQTERTPLVRGVDGLWHTTLDLPRGRYEYQFVVDGTQWMADPMAQLTVSDDFGQQNAILDV